VSRTLEQIRVDRRMSKDDLAKKTGLSYKQVNLIEKGAVRPRDSTLWSLAEALDVKPSQILDALAVTAPSEIA
jgi:transcriptional regulator with XRE-family HTH domain